MPAHLAGPDDAVSDRASRQEAAEADAVAESNEQDEFLAGLPADERRRRIADAIAKIPATPARRAAESAIEATPDRIPTFARPYLASYRNAVG